MLASLAYVTYLKGPSIASLVFSWNSYRSANLFKLYVIYFSPPCFQNEIYVNIRKTCKIFYCKKSTLQRWIHS